MGQRLVVSVVEDQVRVATVYFHWSGYTRSIYQEVKEMIDLLEGKTVEKKILVFEHDRFTFVPITSRKIDESDTVLKLVRLYESLGGGLSTSSYAEFEKRYPGLEYSKDATRNNGLIDISEEGMIDADNWAEATAEIDLDAREIYVEPFWMVDDDQLEKDDVVLDLEWNPFIFPIDQIEDICNRINNCESSLIRFDGKVYGFIE